jgi:hypothetical protein
LQLGCPLGRYLAHDMADLPLCGTCKVDQEREVTNV